MMRGCPRGEDLIVGEILPVFGTEHSNGAFGRDSGDSDLTAARKGSDTRFQTSSALVTTENDAPSASKCLWPQPTL
jgi:hypothetical protein